jgi:hypothetical protein
VSPTQALDSNRRTRPWWGRWFTDFWGKTYNPTVVDEIAAPDMLLKYSLHKPRHGREDIKAFMRGFRAAFPDLNFWGTADLIAEGDYVIGQWEGALIQAQPSAILWWARCRRHLAGRCISPGSRY